LQESTRGEANRRGPVDIINGIFFLMLLLFVLELMVPLVPNMMFVMLIMFLMETESRGFRRTTLAADGRRCGSGLAGRP
jgi:hypothetical protein